jgi:hypothetical protein
MIRVRRRGMVSMAYRQEQWNVDIGCVTEQYVQLEGSC